MEFPHARYNVVVIKEGSCHEKADCVHGSTGITLVLGPHTILVGTGLPQDRDILLKGLADNKTSVEKIEYVVCPYGHVETTGNLNLFPSAIHIVGYSIMKGDKHVTHDFHQDIPYEIDDDLEVIATPGLFPHVVSVMCRDTPVGVVAIAGGVFHTSDDLETPELWVDESQDADTQQQARITILHEAHFIIPRYSAMYRVPDCYKGSGMNVVITP